MATTVCEFKATNNYVYFLWSIQFLTGTISVFDGHTFLKFLIKQLEAIKFAFDWHHKGTRHGVNKYKKNFVQRAFDHEPAHRSLRPDGSLTEKVAYKKAFCAFKIKHGKHVTARNHLLQLYQRVSFSMVLLNIQTSIYLSSSTVARFC